MSWLVVAVVLSGLASGQSLGDARKEWRKAVRAKTAEARQAGVDALVGSGDPRALGDLLDGIEAGDKVLAKLEKRVEKLGPKLNKAWRSIDKQSAEGRPVSMGTAQKVMEEDAQIRRQLDELAAERRDAEDWRRRMVKGAAALLEKLDESARAEAIADLGKPLERGRDLDESMRRIAVLAHLKLPLARDLLIGVIQGSKEAGLRVVAVDALAKHRDGSVGVLQALKAGLEDEALPVRISSARALGALPTLQGLPLLIARLESAEGRLIDELLDSMEDLAGRGFSDNATLWKEWWSKDGEGLQKRLEPLLKGEPSSDALDAIREKGLGVGLPIVLRALGLDEDAGTEAKAMEGLDATEAAEAVAGALEIMPPRIRKRLFNRLLLNPLLREDDPARAAQWLRLAGVVADERMRNVCFNTTRREPALGRDAKPGEVLALRVAAIRGLGYQDDPKGTEDRPASPIIIPRLRSIAQRSDENAEVRAAAVTALEKRARRGLSDARAAVAALIGLVGEGDGALAAMAQPALQRLTDQKLQGFAAWRAWWTKERKSWEPDGLLAKGDQKPQEKQGGGTSFYGIPSRSKHVVYILDRSGSMTAGDAKGNTTRIDAAKKELIRAIRSLPDDATFNIIFYNHEFAVWQKKMAKADAKTRAKAVKWIKSIDAVGNTNVFDPIEHAFLMAGRGTHDRAYGLMLDTIFFLSDGQPNRGRIVDPRQILEEVKRMNSLKKVKVHTIGIGSGNGPGGGHNAAFMRSLAEATGGVYVGR